MGTVNKALKYWATLIGVYLAVYYWTGATKDVQAVTGFVGNTTHALQGR